MRTSFKKDERDVTNKRFWKPFKSTVIHLWMRERAQLSAV